MAPSEHHHGQIRFGEVIPIVKKEAQKRLGKNLGENLRPVLELPIQLPEGWRVPFDQFIDERRVRDAMLIYFVDHNGNCTIEFDGAQRHDKVIAEIRKQGQPNNYPKNVSLDQAYAAVNKDQRNARIEKVEEVWDVETPTKQQSLLKWRFSITQQGKANALLIGADSNQQPITRPIGKIRSFARPAKPSTPEHIRDFLVKREGKHAELYRNVAACLVQLDQFIVGLKYGGMRLYSLRVLFVPNISNDGATVTYDDSVPVLLFPETGNWATDRSIILHELGHALWHMLFIRAPGRVDLDTYGKDMDAVQEGFCDYLAGAVLTSTFDHDLVQLKNCTIDVGGKLRPQERKSMGLPRTIDGSTPSKLADRDTHVIGRNWANLLWDLRERIGPEKANALIVSAHIKPRMGVSASAKQTKRRPYLWYVESLRNTAKHMEIAFHDWDTLRKKHRVAEWEVTP